MNNSTFAQRLINSARDAALHAQGMKKLRSSEIEIRPVTLFSANEIKELRNKLNVTQSVFGGIVGVSNKTVEAWGLGTRTPSTSALRVLDELDNNPEYFNRLYKFKA
ncbi:MAG: transcriptional regulator [Clostridiales Family XIII bacterium]|jgi:putative transcriptional regulator|nr:transcriptional regulator [Clostridiales Family XIII bacterium]